MAIMTEPLGKRESLVPPQFYIDEAIADLRAEFDEAVGYSFPWGAIRESVMAPDDEYRVEDGFEGLVFWHFVVEPVQYATLVYDTHLEEICQLFENHFEWVLQKARIPPEVLSVDDGESYDVIAFQSALPQYGAAVEAIRKVILPEIVPISQSALAWIKSNNEISPRYTGDLGEVLKFDPQRLVIRQTSR